MGFVLANPTMTFDLTLTMIFDFENMTFLLFMLQMKRAEIFIFGYDYDHLEDTSLKITPRGRTTPGFAE